MSDNTKVVHDAAAKTEPPALIECAACDGQGCTHYPDGEWQGKCAACEGTGINQATAEGAGIAQADTNSAALDERAHQFRKKPVVIDAVQWNGHKFDNTPPEWFGKALYVEPGKPGFIMRWGDDLLIETLEGQMRALPGDWIIRGIKGELYPCKPDIFAASYEPARAAIDKGARQAAPEAPTLTQRLNTPEQIDAYARQLAMSLWRTHYRLIAPEFELLDDTYGVLSQIDNMLTGLVLASTGAAPEAPASEQQTKHIGYISQSSLEGMPLLKNEKDGICPAIMPNESDVGSPTIAVYVLATPAATTASASIDSVLGPRRWSKEAEMMESWSIDGQLTGAPSPVKQATSIDTPEFRALFEGLIGPTGSIWPKVIAYIDGRIAGTAPPIDTQHQAWDAAVLTVRAGFEQAQEPVRTFLIQCLDSMNTYAQTTFAAPTNQPKEEGK